MAANPLLDRQSSRPGRVTEESLHDYADKLNGMHWVRSSGKPYFVSKRLENGVEIHFLDRNG
jgi:hypothetical protein